MTPDIVRSVRMFNADEAAAYLGVSVPSIQRWANSGKLSGFRDRLGPGGPWRFTQQNLDDFRKQSQAGNRPGAVDQ